MRPDQGQGEKMCRFLLSGSSRGGAFIHVFFDWQKTTKAKPMLVQ